MTILSWLIDSRVVENNAKVVYKNETGEQLLLGMLTGDGIWCSCCNTVITVSDFQLHAGDEPNRPYQRIFIVESGLSLLACQAEAWNQQGIPELQGFHLIEPKEDVSDTYDDACVVCADGGNLICCDKCPSTYHISCLQIEVKTFSFSFNIFVFHQKLFTVIASSVFNCRVSPKANGAALPAPASSATSTPLISLYSHAVNVTKNVSFLNSNSQ